jgi:hypothetical protein
VIVLGGSRFSQGSGVSTIGIPRLGLEAKEQGDVGGESKEKKDNIQVQ